MMPTTTLDMESMEIQELSGADDLNRLRNVVDLLTVDSGKRSLYLSGFACSRRAIESAMRLRYEVFNLELGEGLDTSDEAGLDEDRFDQQMTHLVLLEKASGNVVGTYRMQTMLQASLSSEGAYSAQEYDLTPLGPYFSQAVELGRACLARGHRNLRALTQLWLGIGTFMNLHRQIYLFGCCSLNSTDPIDGLRALQALREQGALHPSLCLKARPDYVCLPPDSTAPESDLEPLNLPKLFKIYLRLGTKVISEPALDRAFRTVDFLVLLNARDVTLSSLSVVR
jgi:putative hemolysin